MRLSEFCDRMDAYETAVPLDKLTEWLEELEVDWTDLPGAIVYSDAGYQRNLVAEGDAYQVLALCWKAGQGSPIHDHRGSACGVKVLTGQATETAFLRDAFGVVCEMKRATLNQGQVCGSYDDDIHELANLAPDGAPLVTIHVYTPPLLVMGVYERGSGEVVDWTVSPHGSASPK